MCHILLSVSYEKRLQIRLFDVGVKRQPQGQIVCEKVDAPSDLYQLEVGISRLLRKTPSVMIPASMSLW